MKSTTTKRLHFFCVTENEYISQEVADWFQKQFKNNSNALIVDLGVLFRSDAPKFVLDWAESEINSGFERMIVEAHTVPGFASGAAISKIS